MYDGLKKISIPLFVTHNGQQYSDFELSYEIFGLPLGTAPIVLVNHAMTANSTVIGTEGWWNPLVGASKTIDLDYYTVLAFNIPGNGYDDVLIDNYTDFNIRDIAKLFLLGLTKLKIDQLFAVIGGSVGGSITWEMAILSPTLMQYAIPVASDWKASDWLLSNVYVQSLILENSKNPLYDARIHAMNFYRTPQSYKEKFNRDIDDKGNFQIINWLDHHGKNLVSRYQLKAYKMMNHLVSTIDISKDRDGFEKAIAPIQASLLIIGVDSDLFFVAQESIETIALLKKNNKTAQYQEIKSIHGHDAFLIEFEQLENILNPIFTKKIKL